MISNIGNLETNQEVRVEAGCGYPEQEDTVTSVVIAVAGNSALLANGMRLAQCNADNFGVSLTGKKIEKPEISPEAKRLLAEAEMEAGEKD